MDKDKNILGGFEAVLDGFIPNFSESKQELIVDDHESLEDDELELALKNSLENKGKDKKDDKVESEEEEEEDAEPVKENKDKKGKTEKVEDPQDEDEDNSEDNPVTTFFDAISEKLGWEFNEDDNKPKDVEELINYFQKVIEDESKPEYASEEIEALDNFVKQGGNISKYLTVETELDFEDLDLEDETNQKAVVKQLLKEKGYSDATILKKLTKYEEAGLLEDEAQDAIEDLKEIKEKKKEQLLKDQKKAYEALIERQQQFYNGVVNEIKGLDNIRGIVVPLKDKKILMEYILKPDTDGKTKYQKDYAKGGVKSLIESAYFTMNADKLLDAAKKDGNNKAIDKLKRSLRSNNINTKSKTTRESSEDSIWSNLTRQLRIS